MSVYEPIIARLLTLHPRRIDLSLDRMWRILDRLGHPERRIPPVIHVAGTNGKGSTVAFMRAMLEAAGLSVHVYTSPHLVRFNERFRLGAPGGGKLVSDRALAEVLEECERANGSEPITVFEIETAAAFLLFSRHQRDRAAARLRDHSHFDGPSGISWRHARKDRRGKGRDPQAQCAGRDIATA
jgi:dihydrofolate synthase/folylpolyglutamate synthase